MFGNNDSGSAGKSNPSSPAYTPGHADPSVITAGLAGFKPGQDNPALATTFKTLIGGAGGLGRKAATARRSLIGGAA